VAGNFNTLIMLRVKELATAEMLTEQLPKVEVFTLMSVSGVGEPGCDCPVGEPGSIVRWTIAARRTPGHDVRAGA